MNATQSATLGLPRGEDGKLRQVRVKIRVLDVEDRPFSVSNNNLMLDSWQYEVKFSGGETELITVNFIAENLLALVDEEGNRQMILNEIVNHQILDNDLYKSEGTYSSHTGLWEKNTTQKAG